MKKNSSQYEKNAFKGMQYAFWQSVIEIGGKYAEFDISADFLQHSLEKEPEDLLIKEGKVIKKIISDNNFKENINNIIKEYGKSSEEFIFDIPNNKEFPMIFSESDLYFSLNNISLYIKAKKEIEDGI